MEFWKPLQNNNNNKKKNLKCPFSGMLEHGKCGGKTHFCYRIDIKSNPVFQ